MCLRHREDAFLWVASQCLFTWNFFFSIYCEVAWVTGSSSAGAGGGITLAFSLDGLISSYQPSKWVLHKRATRRWPEERGHHKQSSWKELAQKAAKYFADTFTERFFLHTIVNVYGKGGWLKPRSHKKCENFLVDGPGKAPPGGRYKQKQRLGKLIIKQNGLIV